MDSVTVNGQIYKKATVLAKQFRYTTDYIGQLCRNKKVDCQFVGRSWYVTEASLLAHKDARYKEVRVDEKTIKNKPDRDTSTAEISVRPRLLKTPQKSAPLSHFAERLIPRESKYFNDEAELLPVAKKPTTKIVPVIPQDLPVVPAEAAKLKVIATKAENKLNFTDLPAIALTGELHVVELLPDEQPSQPVVLPVESVKVTESRPTRPVIEPITAAAKEVAPAAFRSFTPQTVLTKQTTSSHRFLYVTAILTSVAFVLFVTTAVDVRIASKNASVSRVEFAVSHLQKLATFLP